MSEEPLHHNNPHRYYPAVAKKEHPLNEHEHYRYYPATKKDHDRPLVKHKDGECTHEGMDTHTHTHRYVPAHKNEKKNVEAENVEAGDDVIDEVEA